MSCNFCFIFLYFNDWKKIMICEIIEQPNGKAEFSFFSFYSAAVNNKGRWN